MLAEFLTTPPALRRLAATFLTFTLTLYFSLAVFPFYWLDIYREPADAIRRGLFDPKRYPPFAYDGFGNLLHAMTMFVVFWSPCICGSIILVLTFLLHRQWHSTSWIERIILGSLLLTSMSALWFMLSPTGWIIGVWHFD
jgi:ABC-type phosphate/phosphonate transport system permease subunit